MTTHITENDQTFHRGKENSFSWAGDALMLQHIALFPALPYFTVDPLFTSVPSHLSANSRIRAFESKNHLPSHVSIGDITL